MVIIFHRCIDAEEVVRCVLRNIYLLTKSHAYELNYGIYFTAVDSTTTAAETTSAEDVTTAATTTGTFCLLSLLMVY